MCGWPGGCWRPWRWTSGQIQEETHRFAIEYHRQLQAGHVKGSVLDKIPGVGEKRRAQLLKHFKSVKAIRQASLEELERAVPQSTAQAVYQYFRRGETENQDQAERKEE